MKTIKRYQKKGQMNHIGTMILIVVSAIILLLFVSQFIESTTAQESINVCRFSVMAQVATEIAPGITGKKSPLDINCDKRYIKFYNTKVEMGMNPENMKSMKLNINGEEVRKFKSLNDQMVNQVIAEELRICKYQFADGKIEVFANDDNFWRGKNVCFICSEITFENSVKQEYFDTLLEYTQKTTFDNTGLTYYDYLNEKSHTDNTMWLQPTYDPSFWQKIFGAKEEYANLTLSKSTKYYVFFEKYNPSAHINIGGGKDSVDTANIHDIQYIEQYWVAILPAEDINDYCNLQAS